MSELSPVRVSGNEHSASPPLQRSSSRRLAWVSPTLSPHSTMTVLTQSALPQPLSLLFLQSSVQCFNHNGNPVPCPGA